MKSILKKCHSFCSPTGEYSWSKKTGLYPFAPEITSINGSKATIAGKTLIMAGSNNYLGLTQDSRVIEAAQAACKKYGTSFNGSRLLNGTSDLHIRLEEELAHFLGKEACALFSTGFLANQGTIEAIAQYGDIVLSDKENHACINAGTRLSRAKLIRYRGNDLRQLKRLLARHANEISSSSCMLITDGVFSMSGQVAPLKELIQLTSMYNIAIMVDDAHGLGVLGHLGKGTPQFLDVSDSVDLLTGTFSKSLGSIGGYCAASQETIDYIKHHSPSYIFSAALSPANTASALAALRILNAEPDRIDQLKYNTNYLRTGIKSIGLEVSESSSAIIAIPIADRHTLAKIWKSTFELGVYLNPVVAPAVKNSIQYLRLSGTATQSQSELDTILEVIYTVFNKYSISDNHKHVQSINI